MAKDQRKPTFKPQWELKQLFLAPERALRITIEYFPAYWKQAFIYVFVDILKMHRAQISTSFEINMRQNDLELKADSIIGTNPYFIPLCKIQSESSQQQQSAVWAFHNIA